MGLYRERPDRERPDVRDNVQILYEFHGPTEDRAAGER